MRLAEGHVMSETAMVPRKPDRQRPERRPLVDEELADQLLGRAQAEGVELFGPDGLLSQVTKAVLERALAEEMTSHLDYEKHDLAGRGSGNNRPRCVDGQGGTGQGVPLGVEPRRVSVRAGRCPRPPPARSRSSCSATANGQATTNRSAHT
jgi:hypothetical protein